MQTRVWAIIPMETIDQGQDLWIEMGIQEAMVVRMEGSDQFQDQDHHQGTTEDRIPATEI